MEKLLGKEGGKVVLVSLPPRQEHPLPQAPAQSPPGTAPAPFFFFFFFMEEVKSSVYLAKKNPWNSSWPFLKYNKEAGLLTMGRTALECSELSWEGEEAPDGAHKAGIAFLEMIFPGFGSTLGKHITCLFLAGLSLRQLPKEGWSGIEPGRRNPAPCVWKRH